MATEWFYADYSHKELLESMHYSKAAIDKPSELPAFKMEKFNPLAHHDLVDRPLFIEGRKPVVETVEQSVQDLESSQIDDWILIGIFNRHNSLIAMFTKKSEGKKILKIEAQKLISGWTLKEIESDRVILQQGEQQKMILLRKPRPDVKPNQPRNAGKPTLPTPPRQPKPPVQPINNPENLSNAN